MFFRKLPHLTQQDVAEQYRSGKPAFATRRGWNRILPNFPLSS